MHFLSPTVLSQTIFCMKTMIYRVDFNRCNYILVSSINLYHGCIHVLCIERISTKWFHFSPFQSNYSMLHYLTYLVKKDTNISVSSFIKLKLFYLQKCITHMSPGPSFNIHFLNSSWQHKVKFTLVNKNFNRKSSGGLGALAY